MRVVIFNRDVELWRVNVIFASFVSVTDTLIKMKFCDFIELFVSVGGDNEIKG